MSSAGRSRRSWSLLAEMVVGRVIRERAPQRLGIARRGCIRPRAARRATCADRRPQSQRAAMPPDRVGLRDCGGERTVGAVDVEPGARLAADLNDIEERIDGARAHRSRCPDDHQRPLSCAAVRVDLPSAARRCRCAGPHPLKSSGLHRFRRREIRRLLYPGVGLRRRIDDAVGAPAPGRRPSRRMSHSAPRARAARRPTKFAMLPPLTNRPPHSRG